MSARAALDALALALPLLRETRDALVESSTFPPGNRSTLDDDLRPVVAEYDRAIAAAEQVLAVGI